MEQHITPNILPFDMNIGRKKPETIIHTENHCPFCDRSQLSDILAEESEYGLMLLRNKYNVMAGTEQFVLIEGKLCHSDMPEYTSAHMQKLIAFGLKNWRALLRSGNYQEVLFFKNFGPLSGGTIRHPHMQMIGLPKIYRPQLFSLLDFQGKTIISKGKISFNVSDCPRIGFWELNIAWETDFLTQETVVADQTEEINTLARLIQVGTDYLSHHFSNRVNSYNIFFYHTDSHIYVKLLPRFATPPIFVGYGIRIVPTNIDTMVKEIQELYFPQKA